MNMKIMKYSLSLMCLLLIFSVAKIHAQATVGSDIAPRKGTILDIKDKNTTNGEPNAEGGLGLPRVLLDTYDKLKIANDSEKSKSVGITVYHTGNAGMPAGIYTWDGSRWKLNVSVDSYGTDGQLLQSNGSGFFGWSTFVAPEYDYHKPTQISILKSGNIITQRKYSYNDLTTANPGNPGDWGGVKPAVAFDYLYSDDLNLISETANERYLLIGVASSIKTETVLNRVSPTSFWQIVGIDIDLTDANDSFIKTLQKTQRLYNTAASGSNTTSFVDFFTIVPITGVGKGDYKLKIKVYNIENTFSRNKGIWDSSSGSYPAGSFDPNTQDFYKINLTDINFILYEDD